MAAPDKEESFQNQDHSPLVSGPLRWRILRAERRGPSLEQDAHACHSRLKEIRLMRLMPAIAVLFVCSVALVGQTNKGGISGTVVDANGAAVPGATVTIT